MSVKNSMDKTAAVLNKGKSKMIRLYDFVNSLSVRNKIDFDISVKSDKSIFPLWKWGFCCNKQWRVMPIALIIVGMISLCSAIKAMFSKN